MAAERAELVPYVQYDEHLPMDQWRAAEPQSGLDRDPSVPEGRTH